MSFVKKLSETFNRVNPFKPRQATEEQRAMQKLDMPFRVFGSQQEIIQLTDIINGIAEKSPLGKKLLQEISREGVSIAMISGEIGSHGSYDHDKKRLMLSASNSVEKQFSTLVHEARHASQHLYAKEDISLISHTARTNLMHMQLAEADAVAFSVAVAHEMKENGYEGAWNAVDHVYGQAAGMYAYSFNCDKGHSKAMEETAKAWFQMQSKPMYERHMINSLSLLYDVGGKPAEKMIDIPDEKLSSWLCRDEDGKNYFQETLPLLKRAEYCGVTKKNKEWLTDYATACNKRFFGRYDKSIASLPTYQEHKSLSTYIDAAYPLPNKKTKQVLYTMTHRAFDVMASKER